MAGTETGNGVLTIGGHQVRIGLSETRVTGVELLRFPPSNVTGVVYVQPAAAATIAAARLANRFGSGPVVFDLLAAVPSE